MSRIPETWQDVFNSDGELNLISSDLLMDMLKKEADQSKSSAADCRDPVVIWELKNYRNLISFIFDLVTHLNVDNPFVKYNTCDLYEKFLQTHIDVSKYDLLSDNCRATTLFHMKDKALLRLVNCVMLSTKVSSIASIKDLTLYSLTMEKFGKQFAKDLIVRSELYVMKTVNYKVDQCPLYSICPLLILTLVYNEPSINGKLLYSILHKTMDYYYLAKADIMTRLFDFLKKSRKIDYNEFKSFVADSMLISCAIVAVTPMLVDEQSGPQVLRELIYITCYSQKDIEMIRNVILEGILDNMKM